jgi:hypothetical protein
MKLRQCLPSIERANPRLDTGEKQTGIESHSSSFPRNNSIRDVQKLVKSGKNQYISRV